jgi:hypothetical protein
MIALAGAAALTFAVGCNNPPGSPSGVHGNEPSSPHGQPSHQTPTSPSAPGNPSASEGEQPGEEPTASGQKNDPADLATTASIRREILKVPALSSSADNVQVITADGKVTLRGKVKDQSEKDQIQKIAERVAGAGHVDNQLEVETNRM